MHQVLEEGYAFSPGGTYATPGCETVKEVRIACQTAMADGRWIMAHGEGVMHR